MAWVFFDALSITTSNLWTYSNILPKEIQVIKLIQRLNLSNTSISPEQSNIRALYALYQEINDIKEQTINTLLYPSNIPVILPIQKHTFELPQLALKIFGSNYQKFSPIWTFEVYRWEGNIYPENNHSSNIVTSVNPISVNVDDTETIILNANGNRKGFQIINNGNRCWLKLGSGVTRNDFHYDLRSGDKLDLLLSYTGIVTGICRNNRDTNITGIEFI